MVSPRASTSASFGEGKNDAPASAALAAACDSAAGLLALPFLAVALGAFITSDLVALGWLAAVPTLAWIVVYRLSCLALRRTTRQLPWAVGGAIIRAAALALLAYVVASDDVAQEQRLRSILICLAAYSAATALTRAATRFQRSGGDLRGGSSLAGLVARFAPAVVIGAAGLASGVFFITSDRNSLDRFATVFAVAAGFAAASIIFLGRLPEAAVEQASRPVRERRGWTISRAGWLVLGWFVLAASAGAVEFFLLTRIRQIDEVTRTQMLSGVGAFLIVTALLAALWPLLVQRERPTAMARAAAISTALALALTVSLPTVLAAEELPDQLLGRPRVEVALWLVLGLVALAQFARRRCLAGLSRNAGLASTPVNLLGLLLALAPVAVGWAAQETSLEQVAVAGLVAALVALVVAGSLPERPAARARALRAPARPGNAPTAIRAGDRGAAEA